jgi:ferrous-iron efflux pump FieF
VIVSLLLWRQFGWIIIDPIFAVAIAAYILFTAWQVAQTALDLLMDRELPDDARRKIRDIALAHHEVRDIHDLRTRSSGQATFIQFHLELDGSTLLSRAHTISDEVEDAILVAFPGAEVIIHQDPAGLVENRPRFA